MLFAMAPRPVPVALAVAAATAVLAVAAPRRAHADLLHDLELEGWYGKLGVETGVAFGRDRGASPVVGGVATVVHVDDDLNWAGLQGDLLLDGNAASPAGTRWSFGPEAGHSVFGFDLSYFGEHVPGDAYHHGLQTRAKLTVGVAAVYVRAGFVIAGGDEASLEVGLQFKAPVWIRRAAHRAGVRAVASR